MATWGIEKTHGSFLRDCVIWYVVSRRLVSVFAFRSPILASVLRAKREVGSSEGGEKTRSIVTCKEERSQDRVDLVFS
jgi:hypothetical protein